MVAPALAMVYKEKEDIGKLIIYLFAFLFLVWLIWKVTGAFREVGEKLEEFGRKVKEEVTVSPSDTAGVIRSRARTGEEYLIPREIYEGLKESGEELPANVRPYDLRLPEPDKGVGGWLGLGKLRSSEPEPVVMDMERYAELEAKRWEAYAKGYPIQKEERRVKPPLSEERHILPVPITRDRRLII